MDDGVQVLRCQTTAQIREAARTAFRALASRLPASKAARILLKPNLNSNMSALTGNTTDLRLMAAVVEEFQGRGYRRIAIAEGTNSGFYRSGISVIDRLRVRALADRYGIGVIDLNYREPAPVPFARGVTAGVARDVIEADFLVNMPKLKTHFEVGMSVCMKNLVGTLVGQENKKKTHLSLAENIVRLNQAVRPHLHIVDGIIAMEGTGPTRGTPVKVGAVLVGLDPVVLDLVCARLAGFEWQEVQTLRAAAAMGLLGPAQRRAADSVDLDGLVRPFRKPEGTLLARWFHHPRRQKYFMRFRRMRLIDGLCRTDLAGRLLFLTGLRQDVFRREEMRCEGLTHIASRCRRCGRCAEYCPLARDLPRALGEDRRDCLRCLYCYCVCPERAIRFVGEPGFFEEQLRQYDDMVRAMA